jgi:uncharacterized protein YndB with AHSA1/START domain
MAGFEARAERVIPAPVERVWRALTSDDGHSAMMFGSTVVTDWQEGHPIEWRGEWQGTPFADRGVIVDVDPPRDLVVTHYSPLSGRPPEEATHRLTWTLRPEGEDATRIRLLQDGNPTEEAATHAGGNWLLSLELLERAVLA